MVRTNQRGQFYLIRPPTKSAVKALKRRISEWRENRYCRGWKNRPRQTKKRIRAESSGIITLEAIHLDFIRWKAHADQNGFPNDFNDQALEKIRELINPFVRTVGILLAERKRRTTS